MAYTENPPANGEVRIVLKNDLVLLLHKLLSQQDAYITRLSKIEAKVSVTMDDHSKVLYNIDKIMSLIGVLDGKTQRLLPKPKRAGRPRKFRTQKEKCSLFITEELIRGLKLENRAYMIREIIDLCIGGGWDEEALKQLRSGFSIRRVADSLRKLGFTSKKSKPGFLWLSPDGWNERLSPYQT